jgi:pectate lyase
MIIKFRAVTITQRPGRVKSVRPVAGFDDPRPRGSPAMTAPTNSNGRSAGRPSTPPPSDDFERYPSIAELESAAGELADRGSANAIAETWLRKAQAFRRAYTAYETLESGLMGRMGQLRDAMQGETGDRVQDYGRELVSGVRQAKNAIAPYPRSLEGIAHAIRTFSDSWSRTMEEGRQQIRANLEAAGKAAVAAVAAGAQVDTGALMRSVQENGEQQMVPKLRGLLSDLSTQYKDHGQALSPVDQSQENEPGDGGAAAPAGDATSGGGGAANGPTGWATENGGTTGGGDAAPVTVTTAEELKAALAADGPGVIHVKGMIALDGMVKVGSDTTILGVGADSGITGGGLNVSHASNVIIRNMNFKDSSDDAINVEGSTNVWIDHNSLSNAYDGAIDIKRGSDYITVSWNHISDQNKSMLLGHSDDNGAEDEGKLRVTYDHNWFEGDQRSPRVRFGNPVHVYNNYYDGVSKYGVASTDGAGVLVEANDFENTNDPYHLGEAASGPGSLVAKDNQLVNSGEGETGGTVAPIPYTYSVDPASEVKSIVTAGAGAGKISV